MLKIDNITINGTPLVRERSVVQSHAAAPESPIKSGLNAFTGKPLTTFRDATEREHAPTGRAESVRDVREAFEAWIAKQPFPSSDAEAVWRYLTMAEQAPLPACLRANLALRVAAISKGDLC